MQSAVIEGAVGYLRKTFIDCVLNAGTMPKAADTVSACQVGDSLRPTLFWAMGSTATSQLRSLASSSIFSRAGWERYREDK